VVNTDENTVTLHGKSLDAALVDLIKARPHWQPRKPAAADTISAEAERAALLASHENWGQSKENPDTENKENKSRSTNPWSRQGWSITQQGKLIRALGIQKAGEIAKAAGCVIGSTRPAEMSPAEKIGDRAFDSSNPWTKEGWNLTKQGQVTKQLGIAKATELAEQAGVTLGATRPA
jgi:hypothetical protein